jgi:mRNA interferase MazF
MVNPDPRTRWDPCSNSITRIESGVGSASVTAVDDRVLAAVEAAAREAGNNARRRDVRRNVRSHRQRLRARGLRPVQIWLPDLRQAAAQEQARCQSRAVAWSRQTPPWTPPDPMEAIERGELRVLQTDETPPPVVPEQQLQVVAILLDNAFDELSTTLVCPLTTRLCRAPLLRVAVSPSAGNGLQQSHQLMVDALTTVPRPQLGACIGRLGDDVLKQLCQALMVVSGLAR